MEQATARVRLARAVASQERPTLTTDDLDDLLAQAARADAAGRRPHEPGWESTYDLDLAAALGWEAKAARVAGEYSFSADGASYDKGKIADNMLAMAAHFRARAGGGVRSLSFGAGSRDSTVNLGNA